MNRTPMDSPSEQVLLIVFKQSPRSFWGCYGSFANLTPNLDAYAAQGIVLDRFTLGIPDREKIDDAPWLERQLARLSEQGVPVLEVAIEEAEIPAFEDIEELEEEILDQIEECREAGNVVPALTVVRLPRIPLSLLPEIDVEDEADDWEPDVEDDDEELDDEERPPGKFPYGLLSFEEQVNWERIVGWEDAFLPKIIEAWESTLEGSRRLVIVTSEEGNSCPFVSDAEGEKNLERRNLLPCLLFDSEETHQGMRIGELTSVDDLPPTIKAWLERSESGVNSGSWWSLLNDPAKILHQRLFARSLQGDLLVWFPEAFLIQAESVQIHLKPEDRWDLSDVSLEQPRLTEQLLGDIEQKESP